MEIPVRVVDHRPIATLTLQRQGGVVARRQRRVLQHAERVDRRQS
jgi:hypothetical protein